MDDIVKELAKVIKWIPKKELDSKWYSEYFDKLNVDLKNEIKN